MSSKLKEIQITRFNIWVLVLGLFMVVGVVAGIMVFAQGLVLTNLSDLVPWGLWITIDLSSIALSAGAFLFCAAVLPTRSCKALYILCPSLLVE